MHSLLLGLGLSRTPPCYSTMSPSGLDVLVRPSFGTIVRWDLIGVRFPEIRTLCIVWFAVFWIALFVPLMLGFGPGGVIAGVEISWTGINGRLTQYFLCRITCCRLSVVDVRSIHARRRCICHLDIHRHDGNDVPSNNPPSSDHCVCNYSDSRSSAGRSWVTTETYWFRKDISDSRLPCKCKNCF